MRKAMPDFLIALLIAFVLTSVAKAVALPSDISDYRVAFVTKGECFASSTNIEHYNDLIRLEASGSPIQLALDGIGVPTTWYVLASTPSVNALDNVGAAD